MPLKAHYREYYGIEKDGDKGKRADYRRCCNAIRMTQAVIQCRGKNGHGPDGAYCKTHAREIEILANIKHKDRLYLPVHTGGFE
jgi:hypothetical protein